MNAFVDLNNDGIQEAIVYVLGDWCGSGGCTTFILERQDASYRVVSKITITQLPIRVLVNRSHGWRSIGVGVQGGGIQPGYEAELRFDGKSYPTNPSVAPAQRMGPDRSGDVVISSRSEKKPLYP
jgi:hypothetical protein